MLRLAMALLNETSLAEDAVHDVFISFVRSAGRFELTGNLRGYLATCVANRARNVNRAGKLRQTVSLAEAGEMPADSRSPDQWVIASEELKRLAEAMAELPYDQAEAVTLHLQGGLKFIEIARLQNVSIKTVQSRYRYGLDKLRSTLNSEAKK